jgi:hypothetical protein
MPEKCRDVADLLVASTLHELTDEQHEIVTRHLRACSDCRLDLERLRDDDRRLTALAEASADHLTRLEERVTETLRCESATLVAGRPAHPRPSRRKWLQVAALAASLAGIAIAIELITTGSGGSVVWAEVVAQVEQAQDYICRRIEKRSGEPPQEIVEYRSAIYGLREDIYQRGELQAVQYVVPAEKMLYALIHRDRTYMRQRLSDEQVAELLRQSNAREIVRSFRDHDGRSLGRRRIDGKRVEGLEIDDPQEWKAVFERGRWRLWVDVETQWPVKIELEGTARSGSVHKTYTLEDFEWNPALTARDFALQIPPDYKLIADLGPVVATEEKALRGLREYAQLVGGRYRSSLSLATAIAEAEQRLDERHDRYDERAGRDLTALFSIRSACEFFRDRQAADREAVYRGDVVTARDFDAVLMRWRLDDGRFRVVFGDLRTETVSASRLAELEEGF